MQASIIFEYFFSISFIFEYIPLKIDVSTELRVIEYWTFTINHQHLKKNFILR